MCAYGVGRPWRGMGDCRCLPAVGGNSSVPCLGCLWVWRVLLWLCRGLGVSCRVWPVPCLGCLWVCRALALGRCGLGVPCRGGLPFVHGLCLCFLLFRCFPGGFAAKVWQSVPGLRCNSEVCHCKSMAVWGILQIFSEEIAKKRLPLWWKSWFCNLIDGKM